MQQTKPKRSVNLGRREYEIAAETAVEYRLPDAETMTRAFVTAVAAINNANKLGLTLVLVGPNGKRYEYSLRQPKVAFEIDARGQRTGKKIDLIVGRGARKKGHLRPVNNKDT